MAVIIITIIAIILLLYLSFSLFLSLYMYLPIYLSILFNPISSIATLAITTLLKTGAWQLVDMTHVV